MREADFFDRPGKIRVNFVIVLLTESGTASPRQRGYPAVLRWSSHRTRRRSICTSVIAKRIWFANLGFHFGKMQLKPVSR